VARVVSEGAASSPAEGLTPRDAFL